MGSVRFGVPRDLVCWMRDRYRPRVFVETGTHRAETTVWAAGIFERVYTIEGFAPLHDEAVRQHGQLRNVRFLCGDSRTLLHEVVREIDEPAIFWLDAHWCGPDTHGWEAECPVIAEIEAIARSRVAHFVLVDDARLFLAPPPLPHQAAHWPDLGALCRALSPVPGDRYVFVHEDVLGAVPKAFREDFVDHLRASHAAHRASP